MSDNVARFPQQKPQPWSPADATDMIRSIALAERFDLILSGHARDQMAERDLFTGDVKFVLQQGFVYEEPEASTRAGFFKYKVESRSPNSNSRSVRIIAIPDAPRRHIKVVTVMWVDP